MSRDAVIPDEKAQRASEEMTTVGELAEIKTDMSKLKQDVSVLKLDVAVTEWMLGFNVAMTAAPVGQAFLGPHRVRES